jgi:hypothetical protein
MSQLGEPDAVPIEKTEYDRLRAQTVADEKLAKVSA